MTHNTFAVSYSSMTGFMVTYEERSLFRDIITDWYFNLDSFLIIFKISLPSSAVLNWGDRGAKNIYARSIAHEEADLLSGPGVWDWVDK